MHRVAMLLAVIAVPTAAQSTYGVISGRVLGIGAQGLANVSVRYTNLASGEAVKATTDEQGRFLLLRVPAGRYRLRVGPTGTHLAQEYLDVELPTGGWLVLDAALQRRDAVPLAATTSPLAASGMSLVRRFGPDLEFSDPVITVPRLPSWETLQPSLSYLIRPEQLIRAPLPGRDAYNLIVTLPGVATDLATSRGLGLSALGQRPASANYLLDGLEMNDYYSGGPYFALPPEAIAEYRVSTGSYTAEYGRVSGLVANAIGRTGTNQLHGTLYTTFTNQWLQANAFERKRNSSPRLPSTAYRAGAEAAGPILRDLVFASAALDTFRETGEAGAQRFFMPDVAAIVSLTQPSWTPHALDLLRGARLDTGTAIGPCGALCVEREISPPVRTDRLLAMTRLDVVSSRGRIFGRVLLGRFGEPDFLYSPFRDYSSRFGTNLTGVAGGYTADLAPGAVLDVRGGWRTGDLGWNRPRPDVPAMSAGSITLPGSPILFALSNGDSNVEGLATLTKAFGSRVLSAGGGILHRRLNSSIPVGRDGFISYGSVPEFLRGEADGFLASVSDVEARRLPPGSGERGLFRLPDFDKRYSNTQAFGFVQSAISAGPLRLTVGLRYESFGALRSRGVETLFVAGEGDSLIARIGSGALKSVENAALFSTDRNNFAGRLGLSYSLSRSGATVARAGYGIYFDRPFDNLTTNVRMNDIALIGGPLPAGTGVSDAISRIVSESAPAGVLLDPLPYVLWIDPGLRSPYTQSWFAGIQQAAGRRLVFEIQHMGTAARKLISTDPLNRIDPTLPGGRANPGLPRSLQMRSNAAASQYLGLGSSVRYRSNRATAIASYTYSHAMDNQSEPLLGDFANVQQIYGARRNLRPGIAGFQDQQNSRGDRGPADFDQRHNLILHAHAETPAAGQGWQSGIIGRWEIGAIASVRSGSPYTVFDDRPGPLDAGPQLSGRRAKLRPGSSGVPAQRLPSGTGVRLLNASEFLPRSSGAQGSTGRNAFAGPSFWGFDLAAGRAIRLRGDATRLVVRADFLNIFNHANLSNPVALLSAPDFGVSYFGRTGARPDLVSAAPVEERARRVQLQISLRF